MTAVNLLDREELNSALAYLVGALPCRARGVALVTVDGVLVGQYLSTHDDDQITALLSAAQKLSCGFARAMGTGQFEYNLNVGSAGVTLTLLLDDYYLVCINVSKPKSLDELVSAVREGLPPLLDILDAHA